MKKNEKSWPIFHILGKKILVPYFFKNILRL